MVTMASAVALAITTTITHPFVCFTWMEITTMRSSISSSPPWNGSWSAGIAARTHGSDADQSSQEGIPSNTARHYGAENEIGHQGEQHGLLQERGGGYGGGFDGKLFGSYWRDHVWATVLWWCFIQDQMERIGRGISEKALYLNEMEAADFDLEQAMS